MVDWKHPEAVRSSAVFFADITTFLLGFFGWHFLLTVKIEWRLLTGRLSFRWPYIPYFLGRYTLLFSLVALYVTHRIHLSGTQCRIAYRCVSVVGCFSVTFASLNLCLRTLSRPTSLGIDCGGLIGETRVAIWFRNPPVLVLLGFMTIAHWSLAFFVGATSVEASWDAHLSACAVSHSKYLRVAAFYLYTILYDMTVLVLTVIGLFRVSRRNELYAAICMQGVWYFVLTAVINIPAMVVAWLDLNPVMNIFLAPPAATISMMASSRIVLSLATQSESRAPAFGRDRDASGDMRSAPPLLARDAKQAATAELSTHVVMESAVEQGQPGWLAV